MPVRFATLRISLDPLIAGQKIFKKIFTLEPRIMGLFANSSKNGESREYIDSPAFYKHIRLFSNMLELAISKVRLRAVHSLGM